MKQRFLLFFALGILLWNTSGGAASPQPQGPKSESPRKQPVQTVLSHEKSEVEVVADQLEYSREKKKVIAKGNAVVSYGNTKLTADYAEVETQTKQAFAKGHVFIFRGSELAAKGDEVFYDFDHQMGQFPDARVISDPWYTTGKKSDQIKEGVIQIEEGCLTTCYEEVPNYKLKAKKITIKSGDKMIAWNVTLSILEKPVFWFPYLVVPLNIKHAPFSVSTGYKSDFGAYILGSKGFGVNRNISGKFLADWRALRGVGGGAILDYDYGDKAQGQIVGYLTQDKRGPTPSNPDPYSERQDQVRGRLTLRHRTNFDPNTHLIMRYHRAADEYVLRDFFHKEERIEREQHSFFAFTHNTERYGLLVDAQKRMNEYEQLVERLPEIRADWRNQPFLRDGLFYESRSSFANLATLYGRSSREEDVTRYDSNHIWTAPLKWNEIKLTPYAGARGTYYSRERFSSTNRFRAALGYGADLRTQLYKTHSVESDKFGIEINNLRHVVEPSIQINSIHPSTVSDETLTFFDPVDKIDDQDVITFGLENRIQTKRVIGGKMQRVDIVSLNTFLNYEANPDGLSNKSNFSSFVPELVLRPYTWLQYQARANYDMQFHKLQVFNEDLIVRLARARFLFGHRYVEDPNTVSSDGRIDTSNLVLFEAGYQVSKLWKIGGFISFDADGGDLEQWQLVATRDLGCLWVLDLGYDVRRSSAISSNKELFFNLRMRNFPQFDLRTGSRASFADPRIGETVAGANEFGSPDSSGYYFNPYN